MDCSFCATGKQGFNRNLTAAEIIGQIIVARRALDSQTGAIGISNVVFMGMGEPLANLREVAEVCDLLTDDFGLGLSRRRVTVSTCGLVPQIARLAKLTNVALAVSRAPEIIQNVSRCVVMGGAACTVGNITPAAEFNWWFDPEAAKMTIRSPLFTDKLTFFNA